MSGRTTAEEVERVLELAGEPLSNKGIRAALKMPTDGYLRHFDTLLQKMRKAGRLSVVGGKWVLAGVKECPTCRGRGVVANG